MIGVVLKFSSDRDINRQEQFRSLFFSLVDELFGQIDFVGFDQGFADAIALGSQEGIGHAAADDHEVDFGQEVGNDFDLVGNFSPADDGCERMSRVVDSPADEADFFFQQEAGCHGQEFRNACDRSMSAVAAAESVVDADFSQRSELAGEIFAVFFFFFMETEIFQEQDFTRFEGVSHGFRFCTDAIRSEFDIKAEEFRQAFGNGFQRILFDDLSLRATEMAGQDDGCFMVEQVFNGRQRLLDTRIVCNVAVFIKGDVEVSADKDAFVFDIYISNRFFH